MSAATTSWAGEVRVGLGPGWRFEDPDPADIEQVTTRVLRVVAVSNSQPWVYLEDLGWRRVALGGRGGMRSLLATCCRARLGRQRVDVEVTPTHLLSLGQPGSRSPIMVSSATAPTPG